MVIDIHSHILPGVDDGAQTESDSVLMAQAAIKEGITHIVATPHHRNRTYDNYRNEIRSNVQVLNELYESKGLDLTVLPGQEVRIYGEIETDLQQGEIQTVNDSKYLLIEFPSDSVPQYAGQLFYDLLMSGIQPIIVHPERNRELLRDHNKMYEFVRNGALTQVTAASVVGKFGKQIEAFSHQLIEANLTHFIASDAHNTTTRSFYLREAYHYIRSNISVELMYMLMENNHLMIEDQNIYRQEPQRIKSKKKFFGLF